MGGEKINVLAISALPSGSPPRGRGKALLTECRHVAVGITPAWAGKRKRISVNRNRTEDHPRVGGEKPLIVTGLPSKPGSPPRGRGKGFGAVILHCGIGITPAWAGKSTAYRGLKSSKKDHPRVGGEKV